jgi:Flp pilus assembly protein TadD
MMLTERMIRIGTLSVAVLWLSGCSSEQSKFSGDQSDNTLLYLANKMCERNDYQSAQKIYQQILLTDPSNIEACIGLGIALRKNNFLDQSLQQFQQALNSNQQNSFVKEEMVKIYIAQYRPEEAQSLLEDMLKENPRDATALNLLGVVLDLNGDHKHAQEKYQEALQITPTDVGIESNLGLSLALSGQLKEAVNLLQKVGRNSGATARDRQNLAIAYALAGDVKKAEQTFRLDLDEKSARQNLEFLRSRAKSALAKSSKIESVSLEQ